MKERWSIIVSLYLIGLMLLISVTNGHPLTIGLFLISGCVIGFISHILDNIEKIKKEENKWKNSMEPHQPS